MSDLDTFKATYPNATLESFMVDGKKYWKASDGPTDLINIYDFDTGNEFGDFNTNNGAFNSTNPDNEQEWLTFLNRFKALGFNSTESTNNEEKNQKESTTKYTVVGVKDKRQGTLWSEKAFSSKGRTLVYPEDHAPEEYDFIKITPIEYVPALGSDTFGKNTNSPSTTIDVSSSEWFGFESIKSRYQRIKRVGSTMFLPMVPDISESNAVNWGEGSMNALQAAGARLAFGTIEQTAEKGLLAGAEHFIGRGGDIAKAFMNNPAMGDFIKAYFAGQAVNTDLLGRAGIAVNPNLEVLFTGPLLRTFNYNFRFTPRTDSEAQTVRTIIKVFKKTMAPKRRGKIFLDVPAVYKIKYVYNSERDDHPFLNKIKPCALSGFNVQYAPDGNYMTYDDGSMTSYNVSMSFKELEPIYNDDIRDVDATTTGF